MQKEFELGLPPGSWPEVHSTGWVTAELFLAWFKKFVVFSKASKDFPVLLTFDGHSTHTKNLDLIDYARENGVTLLCFPPHCSHKLQPLDVSFMKPLSLYYTEELRKWLRSNPGKVVTLFQISTLFGSAFIKSATMGTAMSGFRATGIYPTDPYIFKECDFLPANTTDIEQAAVPSSKGTVSLEKGHLESSSTSAPIEKDNPSTLSDKSELSEVSNQDSSPAKKVQFNDAVNPTPGCSWMMTDKTYSAFTVSPEIIMPIPKVQGSKKRTTRRRGKTAVLTDSPYKRELEARIEEKEEKAIAKENRARQRLFKIENQNKIGKAKGMSQKKNGKAKQPKKTENKTKDSDSDECSDCECLYCGDFYSKSFEGWVACSLCRKWAHNSCAGVDSEDNETILVCEHCQQD